jgi:hypothetical protein
MVNRIKCSRCDNQILEATARKNHGLCAICNRDQDSADFQSTVKGWHDHPETLPGTNSIPEPEGIALRMAASQLRNRLFLTDDNQQESVCHRAFSNAYDKWAEGGARALSEAEKFTLAIETFLGEVTNGGLLQYLGNESGAFAGWAAKAFDAIGIPTYADVMRDVTSLFPQGVIPEKPDELWAVIETIDVQRLESIERRFWERYATDKKEIRRMLFRYFVLKGSIYDCF